jgi:chromosome segregation ATPase
LKLHFLLSAHPFQNVFSWPTKSGLEKPSKRVWTSSDVSYKFTTIVEARRKSKLSEARDQLDKWAEDMEMAAQKELDDTNRHIRDLQRRSRQAPTMEGQLGLQEEIVRLERKKRTLREKIFDIEDEIVDKRDRLVEALEKRMQQKTTSTPVFTIRWRVI